MRKEIAETYYANIYIAGPIDVAKQILRKACLAGGLCVHINPTSYIYKGGEEEGYVVGLVNYPRFPVDNDVLLKQAQSLTKLLIDETYQQSAMIVTPDKTFWYSNRDQ